MHKNFLGYKMAKERLDKILTDKGFFETKSKAQAAIMAGDVKVDGVVITKAGFQIQPKENTIFEIKSMPFVSRGGFKLDKAIKAFNIDLTDKICLDAGASTGGFTDCMLQNGATKVYSVDVGHGQLAWSLRNDERVVCMEKTNFRYLTRDDIQDDLDFASVDVSFISLSKILLPARKLLRDGGQMVCLIKPQFEAGKDKVGKKGVVREKSVHQEVIEKIYTLTEILGFQILGLEYSPIKGPEGNIEYLIHIEKNPEENERTKEYTENLVESMLQEKIEQKAGFGREEGNLQFIKEIVEKAHQSL